MNTPEELNKLYERRMANWEKKLASRERIRSKPSEPKSKRRARKYLGRGVGRV